MTVADLLKRLQARRIREDSFSIDGGLSHDKHVLGKRGAGWEVYYSERGEKFDVEEFETEAEACECILHRLLGDAAAQG